MSPDRPGASADARAVVTLRRVDASTWRPVAALEVAPEQSAFVAAPTHYLALCAYEEVWHPMAVLEGDEVVGMLMWGVDDEDGSCWLGGIIIDVHHQGRGLGRAAVAAALELLADRASPAGFALSYEPENTGAARLYAALGFEPTGERADDEVVARRPR